MTEETNIEMDKIYDPHTTEKRLYDWWESQGYFMPETLVEKGLANLRKHIENIHTSLFQLPGEYGAFVEGYTPLLHSPQTVEDGEVLSHLRTNCSHTLYAEPHPTFQTAAVLIAPLIG